MTTVQATLAERLRSGTRDRHDALEATPFASAMVAGSLPVERYVSQLDAYRVVLGALEGELTRVEGLVGDSVWSADLRKLPFVERDLAYFAHLGVVPGALAGEEAEAFAAEIRERGAASGPRAHVSLDFRTHPALIGYLYVMEGSTLGALFLRPYVTAAYRLAGGTDGAAYYGSGDRDRWARFTARMNQALTHPEAQDQVVTAAHSAYRHVAAITAALSAGLPSGLPSGFSPPSPSPGPTPVR
ncbi:biliverdin-producing heme oxygenase [Streptomyces graminilatus]|uniref:biliverdin-producing heme oxygenase n=1 Tax=Streptomyces graminilatus TaxID=1464070 RepID=UPI0006E34A9C|nr:biliverdin-producing heme oxygenase [Streptomyces graminilatus]